MRDGGGDGLGDEIPGQAQRAQDDNDMDYVYPGVGDNRDGDAGAACIDEPGGLAGAVGRPCCRSHPNAAGTGMDPKAPMDDSGRGCRGDCPVGRGIPDQA